MGWKRKAATTFTEDKTSNDCPETATAVLDNHSHPSSANINEAVNSGNKVLSNSNGLSLKNSKPQVTDVIVRRSCRILNSVPRAERLQVKPTLGHINLSESNGEEVPVVERANKSVVQRADTEPIINERAMEELPHLQPVVNVPILNQRAMEGETPQVPSVGTMSIVKESRLLEKFEFLVKIFGEFMSKTDKQVYKALDEGSANDLSYKSLYIGSQKKIEDLMKENFHLSQKLEFALGKIEAYEKMMGAMCASKELVLLPNLSLPKKHASQRIATPAAAVTGHETSSPKPKKSKYIKKTAKS